MIMVAMASAVSMLALQASVNAPRSAFQRCIDEAAVKAKSESVKPDEIGDYLRNACAPAGTKLVNALVAFDVKNGVGRGTATSDAKAYVDDTVNSVTRTYKRLNSSQTAEAQQ